MLPRIIPVLLLSNGALVKTVQFKKPKYVGDPLNAVRVFSEKEADELVFLDIDASKKRQEPNFSLIKDIASEAYMPFSYGGGVHTVSQAEKILQSGAEKIVLNTAVFSNPSLVKELVGEFGSSTIVACVNVKKNLFGQHKVYAHVQEKTIAKSLETFLLMCEELGCGEVIVQNVDLDGVMEGYDLNLISKARSSLSLPLVALGGAGSLENIRDVLSSGADGAGAGSFFTFYGKYRAVLITYPKFQEVTEILHEDL